MAAFSSGIIQISIGIDHRPMVERECRPRRCAELSAKFAHSMNGLKPLGSLSRTFRVLCPVAHRDQARSPPPFAPDNALAPSQFEIGIQRRPALTRPAVAARSLLHAGLGLGRSPHDLVRADAIGGQRRNSSPPDVLLRRVAVLHHSFEPANIGGETERDFPARIAQTRTSNLPRESHPGTQMLGSIH